MYCCVHRARRRPLLRRIYDRLTREERHRYHQLNSAVSSDCAASLCDAFAQLRGAIYGDTILASPHFSPPFSAIAPALLYLLHPCSRTAATLCRTLPDFHSVRALNVGQVFLSELVTLRFYRVRPRFTGCSLCRVLQQFRANCLQGEAYRSVSPPK